MSTWLITGCSTGLGRALAEAVIGAGHNAVVTARDATKVADLAASAPERVLAVDLDVTNPEQVGSAVQQAQERFGGVDVLVNNAGYGYRAAAEEGDDADIRTLFETHFFGTVAMIKAVLPGMRLRRTGAIVNLSSIGAQLTPVGSGYYSAAKAAIEGLSGALRGELAPLGISVTVVEPGAFRTDFAGRSLIQSTTVIDDYASTAGQRRKENDTMHGNQAGDPAKAGVAIIAAVESSDPRRSCCWDPTPWPPTATSPTDVRARSPNGRSSPPAPTSTPNTRFRSVKNARRMEGSADLRRSRRGLAMKAEVGDFLVVKGTTTERHDQHAEIIEVRSEDGSPPYVVRWLVTGHEATVYPGCDAVVVTAAEHTESARRAAARAGHGSS